MNMPHYSIKHQEHQNYICRGLSGLQQNGDFVDMSIAADGHIVKVHKIVMSLASPFFKEIIAGTEGHPVVYLNKVSFATLCSILEYVYSGESRIEADLLEEFTQVSKDLHINGLSDLVSIADQSKHYDDTWTDEDSSNTPNVENTQNTLIQSASTIENAEQECEGIEHTYDSDSFQTTIDNDDNVNSEKEQKIDTEMAKVKVQYTISNQGTLQAIFNRHIYNQKYVYKKNKSWRLWRCLQAPNPCKCPATMVTEHNRIIKRTHTHNHPFQDKSIIKKVKKNAVFYAISEAESHVTKKCKMIEQ